MQKCLVLPLTKLYKIARQVTLCTNHLHTWKNLQARGAILMAAQVAFATLIAIAVIIAPAQAKEYIVGDDNGWTVGVDYQAWAEGKDFLVGDKLVFKYPMGAHNVFKVNGTEFQNCIIPSPDQALTSGNDTIVLASPGRKWYLCGVGKHCEDGGQKLAITVQAQTQPPSIAPSPLYAKKSGRAFIGFPGW